MGPSMRYLLVRAALFLAPFAVLMIAGVEWWLSLVVALAFAFAASMVFFANLREEAARDLQRMREGRKREGAGPDDADVEDAALDGPQAGAEAERDPAVEIDGETETRATRDGDGPEASARP